MVRLLFLFFGVLVGSLGLFNPFWSIILTMIIAMVGTGTAIYFFPALSGIVWTGPILAIFLGAKSIITFIRQGLSDIPLVFWIMLSFFVVSLLSMVNNISYPKEIIMESKNYFQYWGIAFAAYLFIKKEKHLHLIIFILLFIALLQVPVSLFQQIFIVSYQHRTAPGDSIVGTFGGNPEGGGSSGALTIFLITIIGTATVAYLKHRINLIKLLFIILMLIIPILLNETKIVFILIPTMAAFMVYTFARQHFFKMFFILLIFLGVGASIGFYYFAFLQHGGERGRAKSIDTYADRFLGKLTEKERDNDRGLSRFGAPFYWASEIDFSRYPIKFLFGHGIGSTKSSGMVIGHLNMMAKYGRKGIGITGTSKLLWETGLIGTILFFLIWATAVFQAIRGIKQLHRNTADFNKQSILALFGGGLSSLLVLATLFYDTYLFRTAAFSFFSYLSLGGVLFYTKSNQA